jgi:F0F1-type ATP synthase membrane subunit b/b'
MPQFDFFSFSTQVFWILIGFFSFYFFILKFYLVKIGQTLKLRRILTKKKNSKNISYDYILSLIFKKN